MNGKFHIVLYTFCFLIYLISSCTIQQKRKSKKCDCPGFGQNQNPYKISKGQNTINNITYKS